MFMGPAVVLKVKNCMVFYAFKGNFVETNLLVW